MARIYEMNITVSSVIENLDDFGLADGESEKSEIKAPCFLKLDEQKAVISYTEKNENGKTVTEIIIEENSVAVNKHGDIETSMLFIEKELTKTLYNVPPFSFDAEIYTRKIRNSVTATGGKLELYYNITVGGAKKNTVLRAVIE